MRNGGSACQALALAETAQVVEFLEDDYDGEYRFPADARCRHFRGSMAPIV